MELTHTQSEAIKICCLLLPRFNGFALNAALEPVRIANLVSRQMLYGIEYHSFDGSTVVSSSDYEVLCDLPPDRLDRNSLVLVLGGWGNEHYRNPRALSWLRLQARLGVRICGIEIGAYLLARCGLLDGKQATTHWPYLLAFQEQFPDVHTVEQLFTSSGQILTCGGGAAGVDLMLHLIGERHGEKLAGEISDLIMHHPIRDAETPQRMTLGRGTEKLPEAVRRTVDVIENHLSEPLTVPEIAVHVGISQRQLERQFVKQMGCSVVQFGLLLRLQHARVLLISTGLSVREISAASGFNSLSHFAYAFKKCFELGPRDYRKNWSEKDDEPQWPGTLSLFLNSIEARRRVERQASERNI